MTEPEVLTGHKAIARFLGLTPRQVSWHDEQGNMPTFRIGRTVCARKTKLLQWLDELEEQAKAKKKEG
ncbi:DNA-binding protein [Rhizobium hidalgonense]|uniref:DNA-binding protein n=1 Tax=Rhizobium hidalgonense TaxID=1538159 RepID=A0ABX4JWR2_9HYPH|nr:DNA-binding protein [Rhizobium hidalgonense]PDT24455.1 DNA-binding protein [Rhizobium hidalgonense]PON04846.1 hypothetical protein ATY29_25650 [Rhizobium hidalgonense]